MPSGGKNEQAPARPLDLAPGPIHRPKLHELVASRLEALIRSGQLKPGDSLPSERDIMAAFNTGRPAVREAFLSLQNKGLIVTESGRRARVRQPSVDNVMTTLDGVVSMIIDDRKSLKDLFDARVFIEAAMARHAAQYINADQLRALEEALAQNRRAIGDRQGFDASDIVFHRILFAVAGNPVFDSVHSALVSWLMDRWARLVRNEQTETAAYEGHAAIFAAVSRKDPDQAEAAMRDHLGASWAVWAEQLAQTAG
ncbi:FCD domain-containing protein [Kaistia dalseonensis]|uniref:DNA-binding FadR family transcriptional regulator n=1 Tax=Kaistia dalseonensis TaxID=410840 RepID=A0ABU0HA92_9HYPH|nr:FCD domain-containing protein [Kaistia dalseonensis]MCX5496614.1 FCD domain-containing protein [Kaistia dalseonensis]MDQ0439237.1 DNA-binding FadR family transcriptional regulator [Kaistia dalseonensis]